MEFQSHIGAIRIIVQRSLIQRNINFNPTLVQLEFEELFDAPTSVLYFNPTLVQLELESKSVSQDKHQFQSHIGAIRMVNVSKNMNT